MTLCFTSTQYTDPLANFQKKLKLKLFHQKFEGLRLFFRNFPLKIGNNNSVNSHLIKIHRELEIKKKIVLSLKKQIKEKFSQSLKF